jgi:hypothetical protein
MKEEVKMVKNKHVIGGISKNNTNYIQKPILKNHKRD